MSNYMNYSLLFYTNHNIYPDISGSKSFSQCDPNFNKLYQTNNLYIKNNPSNSFIRYSNSNPNIIINKNTKNLPLSVQLNLLIQNNNNT